jgi:hypothetical protein
MSVLGPDEVARFWRHVVKGPGERDCWIWVGAIGDDGYGRFWTTRDGRARVLRPHRVAELVLCQRHKHRHRSTASDRLASSIERSSRGHDSQS